MGQIPFTLGMDVCGVVDAVGDGAERWIGRRVVAMTNQSFGGVAEAALSSLASVFDAPPELDDMEAAAFTLPFHTGYLALHKRARVTAGETLLVVGGASAVGTAMIQLGVAAGARVIAVAGGPEKARLCEELGATAIDHTTDDVFDRVMALTDGRGAEVVVDLVGGDRTETIWTCVAREGRYLPVGFNDDPESGLTGRPLRKVSMGNFSVLGVMLGYNELPIEFRRFGVNTFPPEVGREVHGALLELVAAGAIRPIIGRRISMEEVAAALNDHEQRRTSGRTVVDLSRV
jgi:NADPH2:quinone reductase